MTKVCLECGKVILDARWNQKYHPKCYKKAANRKEYERLKIHHSKNDDQQPKKPSISIDEIMKAADAEGLQYGKYCLKHGLY